MKIQVILGVATIAVLAAPYSDASEVDAGILTATNTVRQTSTSGSSYFNGDVAIGHDSPGEVLDVEGDAVFRDRIAIGTSVITDDLLYLYFAPTNTADNALLISYLPEYSNGNNQYFKALSADVRPDISGTTTNGGYAMGLHSATLARDAHQGRLENLYGGWIQFGHYYGADGRTDQVYGLRMDPYRHDGTVSKMYGIYIQDIGGTSPSSSYPIYSKWDKPSYLKGDLGIGTDSPTETLEVAGTIKATGGVVYIAPVGDIQMGSYTNGL